MINEKSGVINTQKSILDYRRALDYDLMMKYLETFANRYDFIDIGILGESIFGRKIPIIKMGIGEPAVLYVGAHHAMEWITGIILLRYINEFCEVYKNGGRAYNYTGEYIYSSRTVYVVPMLNPDGVDYQINGVDKDNILYDRLIKMNRDSEDFSFWQANARGVDLNHNYAFGFSEYKAIEEELGICDGAASKYSGNEPESEPETASLCAFLRQNEAIRAVISLHTQGEEIYYSSGGRLAHRSNVLGHIFSRLSGYKLSVPTGSAVYGGLLDYCIGVLKLPAFTIECGKGANPLPLSDYLKIYADLRELLFVAPTMI